MIVNSYSSSSFRFENDQYSILLRDAQMIRQDQSLRDHLVSILKSLLFVCIVIWWRVCEWLIEFVSEWVSEWVSECMSEWVKVVVECFYSVILVIIFCFCIVKWACLKRCWVTLSVIGWLNYCKHLLERNHVLWCPILVNLWFCSSRENSFSNCHFVLFLPFLSF